MFAQLNLPVNKEIQFRKHSLSRNRETLISFIDTISHLPNAAVLLPRHDGASNFGGRIANWHSECELWTLGCRMR